MIRHATGSRHFLSSCPPPNKITTCGTMTHHYAHPLTPRPYDPVVQSLYIPAVYMFPPDLDPPSIPLDSDPRWTSSGCAIEGQSTTCMPGSTNPRALSNYHSRYPDQVRLVPPSKNISPHMSPQYSDYSSLNY